MSAARELDIRWLRVGLLFCSPDWRPAIEARIAELAEYRYEEGRLLCLDAGLRCKAWGHPDFPPRAVMNWLIARFLPQVVVETQEEIAARHACWRAAREAGGAARAKAAAEAGRQGVLTL